MYPKTDRVRRLCLFFCCTQAGNMEENILEAIAMPVKKPYNFAKTDEKQQTCV